MSDDDDLDIVSNESSDVEVDTSAFDAQLEAINKLKQESIDKAKREKRRERKEKEEILVAGTPVKKGELTRRRFSFRSLHIGREGETRDFPSD